jgi:hypothetical protein
MPSRRKDERILYMQRLNHSCGDSVCFEFALNNIIPVARRLACADGCKPASSAMHTRGRRVQQAAGVFGCPEGGWTSNHPLVPARIGHFLKYKKSQ